MMIFGPEADLVMNGLSLKNYSAVEHYEYKVEICSSVARLWRWTKLCLEIIQNSIEDFKESWRFYAIRYLFIEIVNICSQLLQIVSKDHGIVCLEIAKCIEKNKELLHEIEEKLHRAMYTSIDSSTIRDLLHDMCPCLYKSLIHIMDTCSSLLRSVHSET